MRQTWYSMHLKYLYPCQSIFIKALSYFLLRQSICIIDFNKVLLTVLPSGCRLQLKWPTAMFGKISTPRGRGWKSLAWTCCSFTGNFPPFSFRPIIVSFPVSNRKMSYLLPLMKVYVWPLCSLLYSFRNGQVGSFEICLWESIILRTYSSCLCS